MNRAPLCLIVGAEVLGASVARAFAAEPRRLLDCDAARSEEVARACAAWSVSLCRNGAPTACRPSEPNLWSENRQSGVYGISPGLADRLAKVHDGLQTMPDGIRARDLRFAERLPLCSYIFDPSSELSGWRHEPVRPRAVKRVARSR